MTYKDYRPIKIGDYCSVGMFGDNVYAYEFFTGMASLPVYIQITKEEFDNFSDDNNFGNRKALCSAYKGNTEINTSDILTDEEIERKKIDKSLWRAGVYSEEFYNGLGVVVMDYVPYKLTKQAYEAVPVDASALSGFRNTKIGYLWRLVYEEIILGKHKKGTYCEAVRCRFCGEVFYFNDSNIPVGEKYEVFCPDCKSTLIKKRCI